MLAVAKLTPTKEQFRPFYERYFAIVWTQLLRFRVREADAPDLAHEVLTVAYRRFSTIPPHVEDWLARVSFEIVRNYRAKASNRLERLVPEVDQLEASSAESEAEDEIAEMVIEALTRMPEDQRDLILRHHVADTPLHVIAEDLGVARSTVQRWMAAAEATFIKWIEEMRGTNEDDDRKNRAVPIILAALMPRSSGDREAMDCEGTAGWLRFTRSGDAPTREKPEFVKGLSLVPKPSSPWVFRFVGAAAATTIALVLGSLGYDGANAASDERAEPEVRAIAMAPVIEDPVDAGESARPMRSSAPTIAPPQTGEPAIKDREKAELDRVRDALDKNDPERALVLLDIYLEDYPDTAHTVTCALLRRRARKQIAERNAKKNDAGKEKP